MAGGIERTAGIAKSGAETQSEQEQMLRQSDSVSRALLSAVPDLLFRVRADGTYLEHIASRWEKLYVPPEQFLGRRVEEVLPAEVAQPLMECTRRALESGGVEVCEYTLRLHDELNFFEARVVAVGRDEVLHIIRDMTERRRAEEKLRVTKVAVDRASDAVFWIARSGQILYANEAACRSLGYTPEELLTMTVKDIDPQFPAERWPNHWEDVRRHGRLSFESVHRRKSGETFPVLITINRIEYGGEEFNWAFARDITEAKRAEEAVREGQRRLQLIMDTASVCIVYIDQEQRVRFANRTYARRVGRPAEMIIGRTLREILGEVAYGIIRPYLEQALRGHEVHFEATLPFHDVGDRYAQTTYVPDRGADGATRGVVGVVVDISERKQMEEALAQSKGAAEEANRAKDRFLAVLSHELRTPLTPVLALAAVLEKDQRLPAEAREDLSLMRRNVELEARLIDDLLDLTRISRGKLEVRKQPLDLWEVLRHTVAICTPDVEAKEQHLQLDLHGAECWLQGDSHRLQQVFWNLIKNAIKFTPADGWIAVRGSPAGEGRIVVEVADSGVGIDPVVLPRIFGAFEQGSRSVTRDFGGLGLGLAISRELVEMHGGSIEAHSEGRGKGSTFRVVLPAGVAPPERHAAGAAAPATKRHTGNLRILLVEDHVDTARIVSHLLRVSGYNVTTAGTKQAALAAARAQEFEVIVSDLGLPDGSGLDLMRELHGNLPELKGIALSGYGTDEDVERSRAAGFVEHLTKPISVDRLLEAIERM